jgi:hypothetical protein
MPFKPKSIHVIKPTPKTSKLTPKTPKPPPSPKIPGKGTGTAIQSSSINLGVLKNHRNTLTTEIRLTRKIFITFDWINRF